METGAPIVPGSLAGSAYQNLIPPNLNAAGAGAKPTTPGSKSGANVTEPVGNSHKESTTNYELDKTISHVKKAVGGIKRLSVAVVVNNKATRDKKGKINYRALTKEELEQVYNLAKEAMGFNQERGDTLNVVNAPFNLEDSEPLAETPAWKDPAMQSLAKDAIKYVLIAGGLLYLILGVLRPMVRNLAIAGRQQEEALAASDVTPSVDEAAEEVGDVVQIGRKPSSYEEELQLVKEMAKQDPKIMANVVKDWVNKE